jgi:probable H4MPT-linked C1 transfer pathway protein
MKSLGIDVGGANLKVSTANGDFRLIYFPMWKRLNELEDLLKKIEREFSPDRTGVVMTAELSDVFPTKEEGVLTIAKIIQRVFGSAYYLDLDGELRDYDYVKFHPKKFTASNWVASAKFLLKDGWRNIIFADMGSTTTDLIPITDRIEAGRTDYERLKREELLYFGVLRTPIFYILPKFDVPLASEFFAISADAFVVTGDIKPEDYTCETPDGRGKDARSCMQRLARAVCCDLDEVGEDYVKAMAEAFRESMLRRLKEGILQISEKFRLDRVLGCGIGEFLLREATELAGLEYVSIAEGYGRVSDVFPAYAMARLVVDPSATISKH